MANAKKESLELGKHEEKIEEVKTENKGLQENGVLIASLKRRVWVVLLPSMLSLNFQLLTKEEGDKYCLIMADMGLSVAYHIARIRLVKNFLSSILSYP